MVDRKEDIGDIARRWWNDYRPRKPGETRGKSQSAAFAKLRRAGNAIEAFLEPATFDLFRRLDSSRLSAKQQDRVAILAALLAHVREDAPDRIARAIGPESPSDDIGKTDETAKLKYARFRRLLQATDDELLDQMRRLIRLLDGRANVADLARSVIFWNDKIKKDWLLEYFKQSPGAAKSEAAPASSPPESSPTDQQGLAS